METIKYSLPSLTPSSFEVSKSNISFETHNVYIKNNKTGINIILLMIIIVMIINLIILSNIKQVVENCSIF